MLLILPSPVSLSPLSHILWFWLIVITQSQSYHSSSHLLLFPLTPFFTSNCYILAMLSSSWVKTTVEICLSFPNNSFQANINWSETKASDLTQSETKEDWSKNMSLNCPRWAKSGLISEQVRWWREASSYWTPCRLSHYSESKAWLKSKMWSIMRKVTLSIRCIGHCCHFSCTDISLHYISWLCYHFLGKPEVSKRDEISFQTSLWSLGSGLWW